VRIEADPSKRPALVTTDAVDSVCDGVTKQRDSRIPWLTLSEVKSRNVLYDSSEDGWKKGA
jgi:hypothetical protein